MTTALWETDAFRDELHAFVAEAVGEPTSFEQVRLRPWSTVWRAETPAGVFYAKDNCAGQRHEAATVARLAELAPDLIVEVAAADPVRGFLLTADGGPVLSATPRAADPDTWAQLLAASARLQRATAPSIDELGLTVLAPAGSAAYVRDVADRLAALPDGDPRRLGDADRAAVLAALPDVVRWGEQVSALGLPLTLVHNDLHGRNVLLGEGGLRFFDFGDAVAGDPLTVLRIPLADLARAWEVADDDPRLAPMADAALEVWSDLAPLAELRAALPAALQLARLARVESWWRCLASMTDEELAEHGDAPAWWLHSLTETPVTPYA